MKRIIKRYAIVNKRPESPKELEVKEEKTLTQLQSYISYYELFKSIDK